MDVNMGSMKFWCIAIGSSCLLAFVVATMQQIDEISMIVGILALVAPFFAWKRARELNRSPIIWSVLSLMFPYLVPFIIAFIGPSKGGASVGNGGGLHFTAGNRVVDEESQKHKRHIIFGFLWVAGGLTLTAASEQFIFWGAVLFGGIEFLTGVIGWFSRSSERNRSAGLTDQIREIERISTLENPDEYPGLLLIRELIEEQRYELALKQISEELKITGSLNEQIGPGVIERLFIFAKETHGKNGTSFAMDEGNFRKLLESNEACANQLDPYIEQYGYDRVSMTSPNFGLNLEPSIIEELRELDKEKTTIGNEIVTQANLIGEFEPKDESASIKADQVAAPEIDKPAETDSLFSDVQSADVFGLCVEFDQEKITEGLKDYETWKLFWSCFDRKIFGDPLSSSFTIYYAELGGGGNMFGGGNYGICIEGLAFPETGEFLARFASKLNASEGYMKYRNANGITTYLEPMYQQFRTPYIRLMEISTGKAKLVDEHTHWPLASLKELLNSENA